MSENILRILVVDDDESIRVNLGCFLEDEGYDVATVGTGTEAINLLFPSSEPSFDVAIVDIRLPDMDGSALILLADEKEAKTKFLILTGSLDFELPMDLLQIGFKASQLFRKPLEDMETMLPCIEMVTRKKN